VARDLGWTSAAASRSSHRGAWKSIPPQALSATFYEGVKDVSAAVLDAAIAVHRALGPGLLESVYEVVLAHVLRQRGLAVARQVPISITYEGITFDDR